MTLVTCKSSRFASSCMLLGLFLAMRDKWDKSCWNDSSSRTRDDESVPNSSLNESNACFTRTSSWTSNTAVERFRFPTSQTTPRRIISLTEKYIEIDMWVLQRRTGIPLCSGTASSSNTWHWNRQATTAILWAKLKWQGGLRCGKLGWSNPVEDLSTKNLKAVN